MFLLLLMRWNFFVGDPEHAGVHVKNLYQAKTNYTWALLLSLIMYYCLYYLTAVEEQYCIWCCTEYESYMFASPN